MIEEAARAAVEGRDRFHVVRRELEIEHVEVLGDALGAHRLRDRDDAALRQPAKGDLRDALAVFLPDCAEDLVLKDVVLAFRKRSPRLVLMPFSCRNFCVSICW